MGDLPCADLPAGYAEQLAAAKACDPSSNSSSCTVSVPDQVTCSCGGTFVSSENPESIAKLGELLGQWHAQDCSGAVPCSALVCNPPPSAVCELDPTTGAGSCQDSSGGDR